MGFNLRDLQICGGYLPMTFSWIQEAFNRIIGLNTISLRQSQLLKQTQIWEHLNISLSRFPLYREFKNIESKAKCQTIDLKKQKKAFLIFKFAKIFFYDEALHTK